MGRSKNNLTVEVIQNAMMEIMHRPELSLDAKARGIKALRRAEARLRRAEEFMINGALSNQALDHDSNTGHPSFRP